MVEQKYLISLTIQDGENSYDEYFSISAKDENEADKKVDEIIDSYGGFVRAVKDSNVQILTELQYAVLSELRIV